MVGVPRSTGCHLCVKRRVKCDEQKPACANCIKYGAECPGYDRGLKFVAGKHAVRSRRKPPASTPGTTVSGPPPSSSASSSPSASATARCQIGTTQGFQTSSSQEQLSAADPAIAETAPSSLCLATPRDNRAQFIGSIIQCLRSSPRNSEVHVFDTWFSDEVPGYLGVKVTLDASMATLALHILGKINGDAHLLGESRRVYGQSLAALQRALNHPTEWKATETLASAMILGTFELFAGTGHSNSWMQHTAGVSWLIQRRGPEVHQNSFDRTMLFSFRALIVMDCLFNLKDCFLAKRSWHSVMLAGRPHTMPIEPELDHILDLYFVNLVQVPSILKHAYMMRDAMRHGMALDLSKVPLLVQHAAKVRDDFDAWYTLFSGLVAPPTEIPSKDPGSIFETVLEFQSPWQGSIYMGYWATVSILQECLNVCGYPVSYAEANRKYADNIVRSVETVGTGVMGPYRVGYGLRIAYEFVDMRTQTWVLSKLANFHQTYAATDPETFDRPGQNIYAGH